MRERNIVTGFQWLDGSFVEKKEPKALDVATFFMRPHKTNGTEMVQLMQQHPTVFLRGPVKATFNLDSFFIDMNGKPETLVSLRRYYCGLFSHRRSHVVAMTPLATPAKRLARAVPAI